MIKVVMIVDGVKSQKLHTVKVDRICWGVECTSI